MTKKCQFVVNESGRNDADETGHDVIEDYTARDCDVTQTMTSSGPLLWPYSSSAD